MKPTTAGSAPEAGATGNDPADGLVVIDRLEVGRHGFFGQLVAPSLRFGESRIGRRLGRPLLPALAAPEPAASPCRLLAVLLLALSTRVTGRGEGVFGIPFLLRALSPAPSVGP